MKIILCLGALLVVVPPAVLAGGHHSADDDGHGGSPVAKGNPPHRGGPEHEEDPSEILRADDVRLLARRSAAAEAAVSATSFSDRTRLLRDAEHAVVDASFRVRPGLRSVVGDDGRKATAGRLLNAELTKDQLVRAIKSGTAQTTDRPHRGRPLSHRPLWGRPKDELVRAIRSGDAQAIDLIGADLSYASIAYADLTNVDLSGADLSYASIAYADLTNADLSGADLFDAKLMYAVLIDAALIGADLSDALFVYADLTNADLSRADLSYANFYGAKGLTQEQVDSVATCEGAVLSSPLHCP